MKLKSSAAANIPSCQKLKADTSQRLAPAWVSDFVHKKTFDSDGAVNNEFNRVVDSAYIPLIKIMWVER